MKTLIRLEEVGIFLFSFYLFSQLDYPLWLFPILFLLPDLSMLGYLINNKVGAIFYNLIHHRGISIIIYIIGQVSGINLIALIGIILFAHSTLDRVFNYGLKHFKGFKYTSSGEL